MGLMDALRPSSNALTVYAWGPRPRRFQVTVQQDGSTIARDTFRRRWYRSGVTVTDESLAATGFYGQYWKPPAGGPRRPAVLEGGPRVASRAS